MTVKLSHDLSLSLLEQRSVILKCFIDLILSFVILGAEPWRRRLQILQMAANFTGLGLAVVYDMGNGIKLLNFGTVAVFAGDLAQRGHMVALKAMHELK